MAGAIRRNSNQQGKSRPTQRKSKSKKKSLLNLVSRSEPSRKAALRREIRNGPAGKAVLLLLINRNVTESKCAMRRVNRNAPAGKAVRRRANRLGGLEVVGDAVGLARDSVYPIRV